jgi:hypothetical protein
LSPTFSASAVSAATMLISWRVAREAAREDLVDHMSTPGSMMRSGPIECRNGSP